MEGPVQPGDVLAQKYRVDRVLGVGGMGVVVAATDLNLDRRVAVKFMLDKAFASEESRVRFQREARAVVKLQSEHVARVHDTGNLENGAPYIVMEYLEGTDLSAVLRDSGPLPVAVIAEYIVQACDAIAEAHSLGIVHRDLKPANLFISQRPDGMPLVKVLDFGISKDNALSADALSMTKTAAMMGSPLYMSPEQMRSAKDVDHRTDIWSLGIILYEMLAGRVPFISESLGEVLHTVMHEPHPPMQAWTQRSDIPPALTLLIDRCLQKPPASRAPNVAEIVHALAPFCPPRTLPIVDRISTVLRVMVLASAVPSAATTLSPRLSAPSTGAGAPAPASPAPQGLTGAGWGGTADPGTSPRSSRAAWIAGAIAAIAASVALVGGGIVLGVRHLHTAGAGSTTPPPMVAPRESPQVFPMPSPSTASLPLATTTPPSAPASSSTPSASAPPLATVPTVATLRSTPPGSSSRAPTPSVPGVPARAPVVRSKPPPAASAKAVIPNDTF